MQKLLSLIFLFFISTHVVLSQKAYFQQQADYVISVSLDDSLNMLSAFETIEYTNNSPDVLNEIIFTCGPMRIKIILPHWQKSF